MAWEAPGYSVPAQVCSQDADLDDHQFRFVDGKVNGDGIVAATAAGRIVGVLNNKPKKGEACTIVHGGVAMVEASAAIQAYATVEVATGGKAVTQTSGLSAGIALEAADDDGTIIAVLVVPTLPES